MVVTLIGFTFVVFVLASVVFVMFSMFCDTNVSELEFVSSAGFGGVELVLPFPAPFSFRFVDFLTSCVRLYDIVTPVTFSLCRFDSNGLYKISIWR